MHTPGLETFIST